MAARRRPRQPPHRRATQRPGPLPRGGRSLRPGAPTLAGAALLLFAVWSNSFIAIGYLLGAEGAPPRFDWVSLTVARYVIAAVLCGGYCLVFRPRETVALVRHAGPTLLLGGLLTVPCYNLALYYGQQHGIPAPVASLETALAPLFLLVLGALFLGERLTARRTAGFLVALCGMVLISQAKEGGGTAYPLLIAVTALAPLAWSLYSVLAKPITTRASPVVFTYLVITVGAALMLPLLPWRGGPELAALDAPGWAALTYLALPCTVLGFALWTWLLRHLPASTVGLTIFLNPPLTTLSKLTLSALLPATFGFTIVAREWAGGGLALVGLAIAVLRRPLSFDR